MTTYFVLSQVSKVEMAKKKYDILKCGSNPLQVAYAAVPLACISSFEGDSKGLDCRPKEGVHCNFNQNNLDTHQKVSSTPPLH